MPFYVQSFERARWCVNNEPCEIEPGQVVAYDQEFEAMHIVNQGRAGAIGAFDSDARAIAELERLVAVSEQAQKEAAAAQASEAEQETDVSEVETKVASTEGVETSTPAPAPAKPKAKKGK